MQSIYIVTPVLNAVALIDGAIWNVASQQGDFEVFYHVQDGGSTDGTLEKINNWELLLNQHKELLPSRFHFSWDSAPDKGMYDAIQKGFARFQMPDQAIMGWCNVDDTRFPGSFQALSEISAAYPEIDWLTGWIVCFDSCGRITFMEKHMKFPTELMRNGLCDGEHWPFIQQESTFWRKRLWDKVGGLNTSLRLAGDWDLWRRFAEFADLIHVHHPIGAFWQRPGQLSADKVKYLEEVKGICPDNQRLSALKRIIAHGPDSLACNGLYKDSGSFNWVSKRLLYNMPTWPLKLLPYALGYRMRKKILYHIWKRVIGSQMP